MREPATRLATSRSANRLGFASISFNASRGREDSFAQKATKLSMIDPAARSLPGLPTELKHAEHHGRDGSVDVRQCLLENDPRKEEIRPGGRCVFQTRERCNDVDHLLVVQGREFQSEVILVGAIRSQAGINRLQEISSLEAFDQCVPSVSHSV